MTERKKKSRPAHLSTDPPLEAFEDLESWAELAAQASDEDVGAMKLLFRREARNAPTPKNREHSRKLLKALEAAIERKHPGKPSKQQNTM